MATFNSCVELPEVTSININLVLSHDDPYYPK